MPNNVLVELQVDGGRVDEGDVRLNHFTEPVMMPVIGPLSGLELVVRVGAPMRLRRVSGLFRGEGHTFTVGLFEAGEHASHEEPVLLARVESRVVRKQGIGEALTIGLVLVPCGLPMARRPQR